MSQRQGGREKGWRERRGRGGDQEEPYQACLSARVPGTNWCTTLMDVTVTNKNKGWGAHSCTCRCQTARAALGLFGVTVGVGQPGSGPAVPAK